jgi:hypothetical protein
MAEMPSMALQVESKALLDGAALARGDRVRLTIRQTPGAAARQTPESLRVVEIQKLP